ncbi:MAG: FAD-dependent oxidoreductase [Flavihumibacter sp.]
MKAVIVGGGIIGLCSAWYLREAGWEVELVDCSDLQDSCSYGNLGMVVPSHFVPLATPGIVAQGIRWMFDSKSPFYVKPSPSLRLISWGLKFINSARADKVDYAAPFLRDINLLSRSLYEGWQRDGLFDFSFERKGIMMYFKEEKTAEEEYHLAEKARAMGLDVASLNREEAQAVETGTRLDVLGAVHYRCDGHLYPNQLMPALIDALRRKGVVFRLGHAVSKVHRNGRKLLSVEAGQETIPGDLFVFAAGSWLPELTAKAGVRIPLMPGKGYSFTLENPVVKLNVPAILCEARVAITPMAGRMRYGGTMELATLNETVNMQRVRGIVESVPKYFPDNQQAMPAQEAVWYGFRPCSPDGLPYIGTAKGTDNLVIGGGHAMMGLSLGPATGKLVAEIASGEKPSVAVEAFRADRYC